MWHRKKSKCNIVLPDFINLDELEKRTEARMKADPYVKQIEQQQFMNDRALEKQENRHRQQIVREMVKEYGVQFNTNWCKKLNRTEARDKVRSRYWAEKKAKSKLKSLTASVPSATACCPGPGEAIQSPCATGQSNLATVESLDVQPATAIEDKPSLVVHETPALAAQ